MPAFPLVQTLLLPALVQLVQPSVEGPWSGAIQVPGMELGIHVIFTKVEIWKASISIPVQGLKNFTLGDVKVEGQDVSFKMPGLPGDPAFVGKLQSDGCLRGTFTQGGQSFPFELKRGSAAPEPPMPVPAKSPEDRDVSFPGFNAFPLQGSVRTAQGNIRSAQGSIRSAQGSAYFAVMVAGSGPTDRDWSNPLIRDPLTGKRISSHGGRDVAAWLAKQGIGSLRYDKRFIGSKDPKLDISLDAQSGDIKAVLAFARTLPEAKGKKILLVGHSEGAMLSLLHANHADALLLLAMPSTTMAKTIHQQVEVQLPAEKAAANLAYLDSVLAAIREGKPTPSGSSEVFPQIVGLAQSLMSPESLGFVKATLDLDPLMMLARVTVPTALAWGDRDVQTWKPATMPANFSGVVIEIKEANHLFKRETRPRSELNGANAAAAYGDDTPLADLKALEAWMKSLK